MRVDALQEAIIHIGTEWQASKVKLALSCHANYRWICARPLKVNKNDYDLEKIKNLISGVWNSSDISLDLGKLHNQIKTVEHSWFYCRRSSKWLFFIHSLILFQEKTFCLLSLAMLLKHSSHNYFTSHNYSSLHCQDSLTQHSEARDWTTSGCLKK